MDARAAARWPAVWAVFAGGLVAGAYICKVPPALPTLRAELGLTLVESGFIATRPVLASIVSVNLSIRVEVVGPAGPTTSSRTGSTGPT